LLEWSGFLRKVNESIERQPPDSDRRLRASLEPFYKSLKITQSPLHSDLFPTRTEFENLKSLKVFWQDKNSQPLTKAHWLKLLPSVLTNLDEYYQALRVEAIRAILAAKQGVSVTKISSSPSSYPGSLYPDSFFDLATSQFTSSWSAKKTGPQPYPQVGVDGSYTWKGKGTFTRLAERRTTLTIQAMVEAAGLDQSTAKAADLNELGRRFTWDNDTKIEERDNLRTWKELVSISIYFLFTPFVIKLTASIFLHYCLQIRLVQIRGSNKSKYLDGSATVLVSYFPQVDVDGKTYLDEGGNGGGELVESGDEEGGGLGGTEKEGEAGGDGSDEESEEEEEEQE